MIFYEKISTFKRPECRLFHINFVETFSLSKSLSTILNTTFQRKVSRIFATLLHRANEIPN